MALARSSISPFRVVVRKTPGTISLLLLFSALCSTLPGRAQVAGTAAAKIASPSSQGANVTVARQKLTALPLLPLSFEPNVGQAEAHSLFLTRTGNSQISLEATGATLALRSSSTGKGVQPPPPDIIRMHLLGANASAQVRREDKLPGITSYFIGSDRSKWHTGIPNFAKVRYENVYPGVSLLYYGSHSRLENDFVLAPGADSRRIALQFEGMKTLHLDSDGNLLLDVGSGSVRLQKPNVYQEEGGQRHEVRAEYVVAAKDTVKIHLAKYDRRKALVIDPVIDFLSYVSTAADAVSANGIAVDQTSKEVYLGGTTMATAFPMPAPQTPACPHSDCGPGGMDDAYVMKLSSDASTVIYVDFIGGSNSDVLTGLSLDANNDIYIVGSTKSADFPVTANALQGTLDGTQDAFFTKIKHDGTSLVYSTYLGQDAAATGVSEYGSSQGFLTGSVTGSIPTSPNAYSSSRTGATDAFIAQIDTVTGGLVYGSYLGGDPTSSISSGNAIFALAPNAVYLTGMTSSPSFHTTPGAAQPGYGGGDFDAFVAEFNPTRTVGSTLTYLTYLGGDLVDAGNAIAVDSSGNAYVTGSTTSPNFPCYKNGTSGGCLQSTIGGSSDAFVTEVNSGGTSFVYSTYLGGNGADQGNAIAVDAAGVAYIAGYTQSGPQFFNVNAIDNMLQGLQDGFLAALAVDSSGTQTLNYSTYLGGAGTTNTDAVNAIAIDPRASPVPVYLAGITDMTNWLYPIQNTPPMATATAYQPYGAGPPPLTSAFVAKITTASPADTGLTLAHNDVLCDPQTKCGPPPTMNVVGFGDDGYGTALTYTYTLTNSGGVDATDVVFNWPAPVRTSPLPYSPYLMVESVEPPTLGHCTVSSQNFGVTCNIVDLPPGAVNAVTYTIHTKALSTAQVSSGQIPVNNVSTAGAANAPLMNDPVPLNAVPIANIQVTGHNTLAGDRSGIGLYVVNFDNNVIYTINLENMSNNDAPDVQAAIQVQHGSTGVTVHGGPACTPGLAGQDGDDYLCNVGAIAHNQSKPVEIDSVPPQDLADCTAMRVFDQYGITGTQPQSGDYIQHPLTTPVTGDHITQERSAMLTLTKVPGPTWGPAGGQVLPPMADLDNSLNSPPFPFVVSYQMTVANSSLSKSDATCVVATDLFPARADVAFTYTSDGGAHCDSVSCRYPATGTLTIAKNTSVQFTVKGIYPDATDLNNLVPPPHGMDTATDTLSATAGIVDTITPMTYDTTVRRHTNLYLLSVTDNTQSSPSPLSGPLILTATLGNTGPDSVTNGIVKYTLSNLQYGTTNAYTRISDTYPGHCTDPVVQGSNLVYTCTIGRVLAKPQGQEVSYSLTLAPNSGALPACTQGGNPVSQTTINASATFSSDTVVDDGGGSSTKDDQNPIHVARVANLQIGLMDDTLGVPTYLNKNITFTTTLTNSGPDQACYPTTTYTLTPNIYAANTYALQSYSLPAGSCSQNGSTDVVTCNVPFIVSSGPPLTFTYTVKPGDAALPDCQAQQNPETNTGNAMPSQWNFPFSATPAPDNFWVQRQASITFGMSAAPFVGVINPPSYTIANDPMYTFTMSNAAGPDTATCVVLDFTLPGNYALTNYSQMNGVPNHQPTCRLHGGDLVCEDPTFGSPGGFWIPKLSTVIVTANGYFDDMPVLNSGGFGYQTSSSTLSSIGVVGQAPPSQNNSVEVVNTAIAMPSNVVYPTITKYPYVTSVTYPSILTAGITQLSTGNQIPPLLDPKTVGGTTVTYRYTDYPAQTAPTSFVYHIISTPSPSPGPLTAQPQACVNYAVDSSLDVHFDVGKENRVRLLTTPAPGMPITDVTDTVDLSTKMICSMALTLPIDNHQAQLAVVEPINHSPTAKGAILQISSTGSNGIQINTPAGVTPTDPDNDPQQPGVNCGSSTYACKDHIYHVYVALGGTGFANVCNTKLNYVVVDSDPNSTLPPSDLCVVHYPAAATIALGQSGIEMLAVDQVGYNVLYNATNHFTQPLATFEPSGMLNSIAICTPQNRQYVGGLISLQSVYTDPTTNPPTFDQCGISSDANSQSTTGSASSFILNSSAFSATIAAGQDAGFQVRPDFTLLDGQYLGLTCTVTGGSGASTIGCTVSPASILPPGTFSSIIITTQGPGTAHVVPHGPSGPLYAAFGFGGASLLGICFMPRRRRGNAAVWITLGLMVVSLSLLVSCGGGSFAPSTPPPSQTTTPAGPYTITVKATAYNGTPPNGTPVPGVQPQSIAFGLTVK